MEANRRLGLDTIRIVRRGLEAGLSFKELTSDRGAMSRAAGHPVTDEVASELEYLSTSPVNDRIAGLDPSVIAAFKAIVVDGRFVESWHRDVEGTLRALSISPTDGLVDGMRAFRLDDLIVFEPSSRIITIVGLSIVAVMAWNADRFSGPKVIDLSTLPKF